VIGHPAFSVQPWSLCETELDLDVLDQAGSVFALGNGHIGLRGSLDEGEPPGLPGTYLNGFYEQRTLPYAEAGYGYPEAGQTVVNVTNGKVIRLLVDDEPFDVRFGELRSHERTLDFRAGVLRREAEWCSPVGKRVRVSSVRLVSLVQRAVAAVLYEVGPLDGPARLVVQSELVANEPMPPGALDPRAAAELGAALRSEQFYDHDARVVLVHVTKRSGLRMAAAMDRIVAGPPGTETVTESSEYLGRVTITADVAPGQPLRVLKLLAYGWSSQRSTAALRDQVAAALAEARHTGWDGLLAGQREYLDDFWERGDVGSIYRAFWQRGADISTTAVLAKLATEAGLPAAVVPDDAARAIAHAWQQSWKRTGLGAVPLLVRTDAHTLHGLVDSGQLRDFLTQPAPPEVTR
jgi:alpha,alpha-trehalose phosphorylase